jgi:hypothetical protein
MATNKELLTSFYESYLGWLDEQLGYSSDNKLADRQINTAICEEVYDPITSVTYLQYLPDMERLMLRIDKDNE